MNLPDFVQIWELFSIGVLFFLMGTFCLAGILVSFFSFSGTWLVVGAAAIGGLARQQWSPWCWVTGGYFVVAVLIEILDGLAGSWGVQRRGGSFRAGVAAIAGGLLGMIMGAWIPIPIVGPLAGMLIGTFAAVYFVEMHRLRQSADAARIARGAVLARIGMIVLKAGVCILMTAGIILALAMTG